MANLLFKWLLKISLFFGSRTAVFFESRLKAAIIVLVGIFFAVPELVRNSVVSETAFAPLLITYLIGLVIVIFLPEAKKHSVQHSVFPNDFYLGQYKVSKKGDYWNKLYNTLFAAIIVFVAFTLFLDALSIIKQILDWAKISYLSITPEVFQWLLVIIFALTSFGTVYYIAEKNWEERKTKRKESV